MAERFDRYEFVGGPEHGKWWVPPPGPLLTINVFGCGLDGFPIPVGYYEPGEGAQRGKLVYRSTSTEGTPDAR